MVMTGCSLDRFSRGLRPVLHPAVASFLVLMLASSSLRAQCRDGTPPPCERPPAVNPSSVAVLYFNNLSRDTADAYLADGLTEELIIRLSQVQRLEVKSRFESQRVRDRAAGEPRSLGRVLRAAYLVTGSLQQSGQTLRLRVALVRAASGAQVWGEVYDRAGDILAIQSEIARAVAGAITGQLLPVERASLARRPTRDPVAYDAYLRGIGAANTFSEAGLRAGLVFFDRAIARDSTFADAFAAKAAAWGGLADGYVEGRVGYARSSEAAALALSRDSSNAEAYAVLSDAVLALDFDAPRALQLAQRAVDLDSRQPHSHAALGAALLFTGRRDESVAEARRGWEADTLSVTAAVLYLYALYITRQLDTLAATLPRMRAVVDPEDLRPYEGELLLAHGDAAGAAEKFTWTYYGGGVAAREARALVMLGRRNAAAAVLDSMLEVARRGYYNAYGIAGVYAALGDADHAFEWLDRAYAQRTVWLLNVPLDPDFESLRPDPRFVALLRRMGRTP
jgi:serine/threonine-protein kinase